MIILQKIPPSKSKILPPPFTREATGVCTKRLISAFKLCLLYKTATQALFAILTQPKPPLKREGDRVSGGGIVFNRPATQASPDKERRKKFRFTSEVT